MNRYLEIACFNLPSARAAIEAGADRIEFCSDYAAGGLTPNAVDFLKLKSVCPVPVYVMIRPRGGDFIYTKEETGTMIREVYEFRNLGADGLVFGNLLPDGSIDVNNNLVLVEAARNIPCTFHRAFDVSGNYEKNLEDVIKCGFRTVLTSGKGKAATEGILQLEWLIANSGEGLTIMPGGGIRSSNLDMLMGKLNTDWFHSSGIVNGEFADVEEIKLMKSIFV
jgi:copper homeostasis protein